MNSWKASETFSKDKMGNRYSISYWVIGLGICCVAGGYFAMLPYDRKEYIETLGAHTPEEEKTYTNSQVYIYKTYLIDKNTK